MKIFREGIKILKKEGIHKSIKRLANYVSYMVFSRTKGGLSSRPKIRKISGLLNPVYNYLFLLKYGRGIDVINKDWDNLIILDACRYDDFEKHNFIEGNLSSCLSKGSDSNEFIENNFSGRELHDTVYISANPHLNQIEDNVFHKIVSDPLKKWDPKIECVKPSAVTQAAIEAHERFPNKKLIIHYMQPHDPPIGSMRNEIKKKGIQLGGPVEADKQSDGVRMMEAVAAGDLSEKEARKAYIENLEIVLEDVEKILSEIDGKSIVTSDHGEMFGEKPYPILGKLYEHYRHPHTVELCKVPWFIYSGSGQRRSVESDDPVVSENIQEEKLYEQLESLGYK